MAKILMVDDDNDFLEASKMVLEQGGHSVFTVNSPAEAQEKIKAENPDLILLDIMMQSPDDGIAFAHKLKKDKVTIPIIMLSGISKVTGYSYGKCNDVLPCTDFLEKPISPKVLIDKVNSVLGK
ncbi:MAG: response regulator [Candidatus Omnitrophica bacterium]|nr:response regulator [Candidatus Omnitrophota bacterium]